jgi:hypothetical protein
MQESSFVKGLIDDGTPLTKAMIGYAQGHATGYQKVGDDNIVIPKQEYELLKVQPDCEFCEGFLRKQTEQLTAEKILNDLWKERNAIGQLLILEEHLKEKAKEFSVEIRE